MTDQVVPAAKAPFPSPFTWHRAAYPAIDPTRPELSAKGKVVVVTGGSGVIGAHIATGFAGAGASAIVLTGRTAKTLKEAVTTIKEVVPSANVKYYIADVTDEKTFTAAMNNVKTTLGPIDVFINNAGYLSKGPLMSQEPGWLKDWWWTMEVSALGSLIAFRAFFPNAAPKAVLINNTSGIGVFPPLPDMSAYQVSKLANSKLFENISAEHPDLFVLNVQPGVVESTLNQKHGFPQMDHPNFARGKYVYCNWDVEELVSRKAEFEEPTFLKIGLEGNSSKGFTLSA